MRVTERDVHVTLVLPTGPLEIVEAENEIDMTAEFRSLLNHWKQQWPERHSIPKCGELIDGQVHVGEDFRRNFVIFMVSLCYLDRVVFKLRSVPHQLPKLRGWTNDEIRDRNTLDKTCMTDEEEQVNEKEDHSKGVKHQGKAEDQTGISKVKDGRAAIDLIITSSRRLAEVITELEEFIPRARSPLKRVRKVAMESMSDARIRDTPNTSKRFLIQINAIGMHFKGYQDKVHDFPQFTISSFSLRVSQEEKESLPKGVIIVDLQPDYLAAAVRVINCDVEDVVTRCMMTFAQCINPPLLPGISSRSVVVKSFVAL
ncbi:LOW QUALITY PROTEIN: hypothetical protein Cgig2_004221 [Carnegiea gigantea]|uniref:Uncharacterized protein n=1 Tax=Carnegiea gigantea TaxID=171969 RepID=A0A9Q1JIG5_9CARY|nr:LOW QUALITY PROTEIN: hypothetical protein Cgig2_004221 [Carnegiea gigantea]